MPKQAEDHHCIFKDKKMLIKNFVAVEVSLFYHFCFDNVPFSKANNKKNIIEYLFGYDRFAKIYWYFILARKHSSYIEEKKSVYKRINRLIIHFNKPIH